MPFATYPLEMDETKLVFALRLRDRWTLGETLVGDVTVTSAPYTGWRKDTGGTFLFFKLPNGPRVFAIRSVSDAPFYRAVDIAVVLPIGSPLWPAYPDIGLADPTLPLSDPGQPAAYRTQFLQCALLPDIAYPFAPGSTLLRGMVLQGGAPVADATVLDVAGNAISFTTEADGQFVLAYTAPPLNSAPATIRTQRAGHPDVDTAVTVRRGVTTSVQINV